MTTVDVVVAGAGHNSLITAAYLAPAGYEVVVLDARADPGRRGGERGAAAARLPGRLVLDRPHAHPDQPAAARRRARAAGRLRPRVPRAGPVRARRVPRRPPPDDVDGRRAQLRGDRPLLARRRRRLPPRARRVRRGQAASSGRRRSRRPASGPSLEQRLAEHPRGRVWQRRRLMSAWDVIRHEYESDHIRSFMLWQAFQTLVPIDMPGIRPARVVDRLRPPAPLVDAAARRLGRAHRRARAVHRGPRRRGPLRPAGGAARDRGRALRGRRDRGRRALPRAARPSSRRSTSSTCSTWPRPTRWPEEFRYGVETFDVGLSGFAVHLATTEAPVFETADGPRSAASAGLSGWPQDIVDHQRALRDDRYADDVAWLLVATPTLTDPSRAPEGHHTVKFLSAQPWLGGREGWTDERKARQAGRQLERVRAVAPNLTDDAILAIARQEPRGHRGAEPPHDPRDVPRRRPHARAERRRCAPRRGGASTACRSPASTRPAARRIPGGSITGAPGRNAATVLLSDLGLDLEEVVAGARRPRAGSHR